MSYKCFVFHYYLCGMPIQNLIWRTTNIIFFNTCIGIILLKNAFHYVPKKNIEAVIENFCISTDSFSVQSVNL